MAGTQDRLGVALVGAGTAGHWSGQAHIPALRSVEGLELRRLVTSGPETAARAADEWATPATHELDSVLNDPDVDLVAITVKVRSHAQIAERAIEAGKHVYCEWPLAVDVEEAVRLTELSAEFGDRHHVVGLQGRYSPALRAAANLVADDTIGRLISFNLRLFLPHGMMSRPAHRAHLRHRSSAANVLTIHAGHVLDMLGVLTGPLAPREGEMWCAVDEFTVEETGERLPRDAPDNLIATLRTGAGALGVTHLSQTGAAASFVLDMLGSEGMLRLASGGQPQMSPMELRMAASPGADLVLVDVPADGAQTLGAEHPGANVARAYDALARAISTGQPHPLMPGFADALALHRTLRSIEEVVRTT